MSARPKIPDLTDEEEAEIQRQIADDPDDFQITDEQVARGGRSFEEVFPDLYASIQRSRGRPKAVSPKQAVSIRLDPDVIQKFRATGKGWQGRINDILKQAKVG